MFVCICVCIYIHIYIFPATSHSFLDNLAFHLYFIENVELVSLGSGEKDCIAQSEGESGTLSGYIAIIGESVLI